MLVFRAVMYMCTRILSCTSRVQFCVFFSMNQSVNNFNELENVNIGELLQYRLHVYTPNAAGKGEGEKGERIGKGR